MNYCIDFVFSDFRVMSQIMLASLVNLLILFVVYVRGDSCYANNNQNTQCSGVLFLNDVDGLVRYEITVDPIQVQPVVCCEAIGYFGNGAGSGGTVWQSLGCTTGSSLSGQVAWSTTFNWKPQIRCHHAVNGRNLSWTYAVI